MEGGAKSEGRWAAPPNRLGRPRRCSSESAAENQSTTHCGAVYRKQAASAVLTHEIEARSFATWQSETKHPSINTTGNSISRVGIGAEAGKTHFCQGVKTQSARNAAGSRRKRLGSKAWSEGATGAFEFSAFSSSHFASISCEMDAVTFAPCRSHEVRAWDPAAVVWCQVGRLWSSQPPAASQATAVPT